MKKRKGFITYKLLPSIFAVSILGNIIFPSGSAGTLSAVPPETQSITSTATPQVISQQAATKPVATKPPITQPQQTSPPVSNTPPITAPPSTTPPTTATVPSTTTPITTSPLKDPTPPTTSVASSPIVGSPVSDSGVIKVHFINVGQGDSIFIELPNDETMLIDAGPSSAGSNVVGYITKRSNELTYVVATHPHADHIGGMAKVVNSIPIRRFYMPRKSHTTKTFEGLLDALSANSVRVSEAKAGISILDTTDLDIDIPGPADSVSGTLNNYSAIIKIRYKDADFLFIGDAETAALAKLPAINMDVLKVGHHGSDTSSTLSFLKKVDPEHSVISVGGNSYGHPTGSALANLNTVGSKVYRTDKSGTIIISSNGDKIEVNKSPSKAVASASAPPTKTPATKPKSTNPPSTGTTTPKTTTVYGTATGSKYHKSGCRYLSKSKIPMTLSEAKASGLTACSVCH